MALKGIWQKLNQQIAEQNIDADAVIHQDGRIENLGESDKFSKHLMPYLIPFIQEGAVRFPQQAVFPHLHVMHEQAAGYHALKIVDLETVGYIRIRSLEGSREGFRELMPKLAAYVLYQSAFLPWLQDKGLDKAFHAAFEAKERLLDPVSLLETAEVTLAAECGLFASTAPMTTEPSEHVPIDRDIGEDSPSRLPALEEGGYPCLEGLLLAWRAYQQAGLSCQQAQSMWQQYAQEHASEASSQLYTPPIEATCVQALAGRPTEMMFWQGICSELSYEEALPIEVA